MKLFKTILCDMDGVLFDFHKAALEAHGIKESRREEWPIAGQDLPTRLGLAGLPNWKDIFWAPINIKPNFWIELEPFPWVEDLLQICGNFSKNVVICSSPAKSWNGEDKRQKLECLAKHGIHREVKFSYHKEEFSEKGVLLIDDWEKQTVPFAAKEGSSILFPQPWNQNYIHVANPLDYVLEQLNSIQKGL